MKYELQYQIHNPKYARSARIVSRSSGIISILLELLALIRLITVNESDFNPWGAYVVAAIVGLEWLGCVVIGGLFGAIGFAITRWRPDAMGKRLGLIGMAMMTLWIMYAIVCIVLGKG